MRRKIEMIGAGFTPDTIQDYFAHVVWPKMQWDPVGIVLHHTAFSLKEWPGFDASGQKLTVRERLAELNYYYTNIKGWPSGPHSLVGPEKIWIFSPPWKPGTGSPSWDKDHFHVELIGDYTKELLPRAVREGGVAISAAMFRMMGLTPTLKNFHFHKEDPRTQSKRCPGVNVGPKDQWVKDISKAMK